ncbi:MAG TPA: macro domain-containing protein, partial [Anaerovoracaceae bacterium]|nr:macro domain-containing protein [Anaerovoracaceae bacterium]
TYVTDPKEEHMPFTIVSQDITKMKTAAIVNAANTQLAMGGGVCSVIFSAAGVRELEAACRKLAPIRTGQAVMTPGFCLPARFIIHAAGPVYRPEHGKESEKLLRSAYTEALRLAVDNHCESVAFPLISLGSTKCCFNMTSSCWAVSKKNCRFESDPRLWRTCYLKGTRKQRRTKQ